MSFTWEEICSEWILKDYDKYNQVETVQSFNIVEQYLGRAWLEDKYKTMKGPIVVISILELGRILKTLEGHPKFVQIIEKIRKDTELDLARLAAFYVNKGLDIVIEPKVRVGESIKEPDLLVTFGDTPVYFEAYRPLASDKYRSLLSDANLISRQVLDGIPDGVTFQIYLLREPTKIDVKSIIDACKKISVNLEKESFYSFRDLAKIRTSPRTESHTVDDGKYLADGIRRFLVVVVNIREGSIKKSCLVGVPFTDKRVDRILNKQYRQLSRTKCNVVVIELSGVIAQIDQWTEGLKARFRGNIHRRIGAVILIQNFNDVFNNRIKREQRIIRHPNPRKPLPDIFYEITSAGIDV
jgi:hypothetical protein